jgi:hypothetical protein
VLHLLLNLRVLQHILLEAFLQVLLQAAPKRLNCSLTRCSLQACSKLRLKLLLNLRLAVQDGGVCVADAVHEGLRHGALLELCTLGGTICSRSGGGIRYALCVIDGRSALPSR